MDIEIEIYNTQKTLYDAYNFINSCSKEIQKENSKKTSDLDTIKLLQLTSSEADKEFTSSLYSLQSLYDVKNLTNPKAGFPQAGERIIHVGETFTFHWDTASFSSVNLFFIKGGTKTPITIFKEEQLDKKSFIIDASHFSDEYLPCKIKIENSAISSVYDESFVFKVLKSN